MSTRTLSSQHTQEPVMYTETMHLTTRLFGRMRSSCPLPVDPLELYRASFPSWATRDRKDLTLQELNALTLMEGNDTLHFQFPVGKRFWVKHKDIRLGTDQTLLLPHLFRGELHHWFDAAIGIDEDIFEVRKLIGIFVMKISTFAELHAAWPELAALVGGGRVTNPGHGVRKLSQFKKQTAKYLTIEERERVNTAIAQCLLLPDTTCDAWIGSHP